MGEKELANKLSAISFKSKDDFEDEFDMNEKQQIH